MTQRDSNETIVWDTRHIDSTVDGTRIRYGTFQDNLQKPALGVFILNGRSEWIEKYSHLPTLLKVSPSTLWCTLDHRGQGGSGGARAHVATYSHFVDDASHIAHQVFGNLPYVLITHSMGGLIGLLATLQGKLRPQAIILCSPLFCLPQRPLPHFISRPLAHLVHMSKLSKASTGATTSDKKQFHKNTLTHSFSGFESIQKSPYPFHSPSFGWVSATFKACEAIFMQEQLLKINCPIRILFGSDEKVVDPEVYGKWCQKAHQVSSMPIELIKISGANHELLNEIPRYRDQAILLIKDWTNRQI